MFKKGISGFSSRHHTQETKNKLRKVALGRKSWNKGLTKETDHRVNKISLSNKGREPWNKGLTKEMDSRVKSSWNKGISCTQFTRDKISISKRNQCKDPDYLKKCLHRRIPSGPEQIFIDLCKEFKYVGNGELTIDGKNPDFVSIKDEHKLIEIWGEYFKKGRNPKDLIDFYKVRGYQCIIIWASELRYPDKVLARVQKYREVK